MTKSKPTAKRGPTRAKNRAALSAQQTIPYVEMLKDGICKVREGYYTKTIAYEDINYSVASTEDQAAIFDNWCSFLNYFDSALPFQLSFVNHRSRGGSRYKVNIPRPRMTLTVSGPSTRICSNGRLPGATTALNGLSISPSASPPPTSPLPGPGWNGWRRTS